jgi:hypothetical protein
MGPLHPAWCKSVALLFNVGRILSIISMLVSALISAEIIATLLAGFFIYSRPLQILYIFVGLFGSLFSIASFSLGIKNRKVNPQLALFWIWGPVLSVAIFLAVMTIALVVRI